MGLEQESLDQKKLFSWKKNLEGFVGFKKKISFTSEVALCQCPMGDSSGRFSQFQDLCDKVLGETSHNGKSKIIKDFIESPSWNGDLFLLCKLLIIKDDQRVFHLREKSLTKLISMILKVPHNDLLLDLQKGDLSGTCSKVCPFSSTVLDATDVKSIF